MVCESKDTKIVQEEYKNTFLDFTFLNLQGILFNKNQTLQTKT